VNLKTAYKKMLH